MNEEQQEGNKNEHEDSIVGPFSLVIHKLDVYFIFHNHMRFIYNNEIINTTSQINLPTGLA